MGLVDNIKRSVYCQAMMKAIKRAQKDPISGRVSSKPDALRVIRTFERVNKTIFDPFKSSHTDMVAGWGTHEALNRKIRVLRK